VHCFTLRRGVRRPDGAVNERTGRSTAGRGGQRPDGAVRTTVVYSFIGIVNDVASFPSYTIGVRVRSFSSLSRST